MIKNILFYVLTKMINYFLKHKNFEIVCYLLEYKKKLAKKLRKNEII